MDSTQQKTRRLTTEEAAEYLGVAATTLEGWRSNGGGPVFYKPARFVYYEQSDLDAWKQTKRFATTAHAALGEAAR